MLQRPTFDSIRAGLIGIGLALALLLAIPSTDKLDHEALGSSAGVMALCNTWETFRRGVLWPVRPFLRATGTGQSWGMFAQPDRYPRRLEIAVETPAGWQVVFRKNDSPTPLAMLRDRRVRALYDTAPDEGSPAYWAFTRWVGRELLLDHPEASRIRFRLLETHTTDPWLTEEPKETVFLERVHSRLALTDPDLW